MRLPMLCDAREHAVVGRHKIVEGAFRKNLPAGDRVRIQVKDSGAGIPSEQLSKVFRKFYQADNQGSASAKGTGLGLAIAKEIVAAHHGDISIASQVGVGTTFTLLLPVSVENRRRTGTHRISSPDLQA